MFYCKIPPLITKMILLAAIFHSSTLAAFDSNEHIKLANTAFHESGWDSSPFFRNSFSYCGSDVDLTFGDLVAISGDFANDSIFNKRTNEEDLRVDCAQFSKTKIEYIYKKKLYPLKFATERIPQEVVRAEDKNFLELALANHAHFLNPENEKRGYFRRTECYEAYAEGAHRSPGTEPRSEEMYVYYHCEALRIIIAGTLDPYINLYKLHDKISRSLFMPANSATPEPARLSHPYGTALLYEAFAQHYLSDSFAAGHIMVPRARLKLQWGRGFSKQLVEYIAQNVAPRISKYTPPAISAPWTQSRLETIFENAGMSGMQFGDLIAGAMHEYYNKTGIEAVVQGKKIKLFGDGAISQDSSKVKATSDIVIKALKSSLDDLRLAVEFREGRRDFIDLISEIRKRNKNNCHRTFVAQCMLPTYVPPKPAPWEQRDIRKLLSDPIIDEALRLVAPKYGSLFTEQSPMEYRQYMRVGVVDLLTKDPATFLRRVLFPDDSE